MEEKNEKLTPFALAEKIIGGCAYMGCHRLVIHGRAVCTARTAVCEKCCCAAYCKTMNP